MNETKIIETPKRVAFIILEGRDLTIEVRMKADMLAKPVVIKRRYLTAFIAHQRFRDACWNANQLLKRLSMQPPAG